ncbi:MAG: hypothetical protein ACKVSF_09590, partial [Alphaproteobacteria bacterium]
APKSARVPARTARGKDRAALSRLLRVLQKRDDVAERVKQHVARGFMLNGRYHRDAAIGFDREHGRAVESIFQS